MTHVSPPLIARSLIASRAPRPRRLVWALALAGVLGPGTGLLLSEARAQSLPTGAAVVRGTATVVQSGSQMTVSNSNGAVLNWQSFNIGAGHSVRFDQADASSKVLNRVVGANPSQIFGSLTSNGQVWLVNPYGVLFGSQARVDVAGLVVSTLNIGADDWRAGRYSFSGGAEAGALVNQGEIRTTSGGRVFLLGGAAGVRNEGLVQAPDGQVALAAGASVDLADSQTRHVAVRVQAPAGEVLNLGRLSAGGGRIDLAAAMVNQQGLVQAEAIGGPGGEVLIAGSQGVSLGAASRTSASGAQGGSVSVDGGNGTTLLAGQVDVGGNAGRGGEALLLGRQIGLLDGSNVEASGSAGGGRIRIGGGLQGREAGLVNAEAVFLAAGAGLRADASHQGDGGTVILWSDKATRAYGSLSARGGAAGGDGGFIETSGGWLDARPRSVLTSAARGRPGLWLLDPNNILITNDTNDVNVSGGPDFTTTNDNARINDLTISDALNAGNNVSITTANGGLNSEAGDILVSSAFISANPARPVSLTLKAARNITLTNSTIESLGSPLSVSFDAATGSTGFGRIVIENSAITTAGGNVSLGGGARAQGPNITSPRAGAVGYSVEGEPAVGVLIDTARIDAGSGNISIVGQAVTNGGGGYGVLITSSPFANFGTRLAGRDIDVWGWVDSNDAAPRFGVYLSGGQIQATHGLTLTGIANSGIYRSDAELLVAPVGVVIEAGAIEVAPPVADATAYLRIDGTVNDAAPAGAPDGDLRLGVYVGGFSPTIAVSGGATATLAGSDGLNKADFSLALQIAPDADLNFSAAGASTLQGNASVLVAGSIAAPLQNTLGISAAEALTVRAFISGSPTEVQLSGNRVLVDGASFSLGGSAPTALKISANHDLRIVNTDLFTDGEAVTLTLTSAASGLTGSVSIESSFFSTGGGNVVIGGNATATGPNLTSPHAGALAGDASNGGNGVTLLNSRIVADAGSVVITGLSTNAQGPTAGVALLGQGEGGSGINAANVDIFGWVDSNAAFSRTGLWVDASSAINATNAIALAGAAHSSVYQPGAVAPVGVRIGGRLQLAEPFGGGNELRDPGAPVRGLNISGTVSEGAAGAVRVPRYGVLIEPGAALLVSLPAPSTITGTDLSANDEVSVRFAPGTADFTTATDLAISGNRRVEVAGDLGAPPGALTVRAGSTLTLEGINASGGPASALFRGDIALLARGAINFESVGGVTLQSPQLTLGAAGAFTLASLGPLRLLTDALTVDQASALTASGNGTTLAIAGFDGLSNVTSFSATNGMPTLDPGTGRWLIYARTDNVPESGLSFDFRQYNTVYPGEPVPAAGNGLVYALAPVLTLANQTPITKVYDGTNTVTTANVVWNLTGLLPGQTAAAGLGAPVASYTGTGVVAGQALTVAGYVQPVITDAARRPVYGYTTQFAASGDITPRPLTLAGVTAADKVYDGTRAATLAGGALGNLVPGETLSLVYANGQFDTAHAGNAKAVSGTVALADGTGLAGNYVLANGNAVAATASVTPRPLTLAGVTAADKVYDGSRTATLGGGALGNLVPGETLSLVYANGQFDTAHAGNAKAVSGTVALADGTGLAGNYALANGNAVAATASVTPRLLTLAGVTAADKVYDGTRTATLAGGVLGNLVPGETLALLLAGGQFDTAHAGTAKAVSGTASLGDGTGLAADYTLGAGAAIAAAANVSPRALTLNGVTAADKVYDGTRAATLAGGALGNLVPGETLSLVYANGQFDTAHAGNAKAVSGTVSLADASGLAADYVLANGNAVAATASVTPRLLTLAGVTAADKVYDGTRTATLAGGALGNLVPGETLALLLAGGQFDTAHAGTAKAVSGTASLGDGTGLAADYTLGAGAVIAASASVTPRLLTLTGVTAADKVYDGSRGATLAGGALGNLVAGETLVLALGPAQFDSAHAGDARTASALATIGNGTGLASDYQLAAGGAVSATARITPRPLTLDSLQAGSRVYDGTRNVNVSGGTLSGLVAGETLTLAFANTQLQTAGVGSNKPITTTVTLGNGSGLAADYALAPAAGALPSNAAVTAATLTYIADPVSLSPAQLGLALGGTVSGFVAGETLATATRGTLLFSTPATNQSPPGVYAINGSGLAADNYVFVQAAANAQALTLRSVLPETVGLPEVDDNRRFFRQALPPLPPTPETVRALDAMQTLRVDPTWLSMAFGELDLDRLSREEIAALLEARRQYKDSVLRVGRQRLQDDPAAADVPACQTVRQAESGRCLVTAELLDAVQARGEEAVLPLPPVPATTPAPAPVAAAAAAPAAAPAPVPVMPAPAPAPMAAPLTAPVAAPAAVPAAASPSAAPPAPVAAAHAAPEARTPQRVRVAARPTLQAPPMPAVRPVRAASVPQIQRKIAVLIAVDNYVDERIPALENAGRDVDAVARVLESRLGYETVVLRDAGREAVVGVLNRLALQARPNDSVVVYYAGHGTVIDGSAQGYWIPATADAERPETWLANRDIGRLLGGIRASQVVLISDSCFSGSLVADRRVQAASGSDARALLQRRATLVMSSGGDEPVADGARGGHSPFSNALMATLQGLDNWRPGGNVFERVREDVTRRLPQTPRYGPARDTRHVEGSDYVFEQRELGTR